AKPPRLSVWLTNALEPAEREVRDLFFAPLAEEARGACEVKRQTPIMCVIGNPPYSGISQNMGDWITGLIEDYKYVDGIHFGERKHWLQDDYVKFIRLAEQTIAGNPSGGVLGFITNHGYLDNPTFRGMRWHLLNT
ncbi:DNA methyltransferase, partial [Escherichia coli]|nr:DNA methyltransferase [Escherichia coli]